MPLTIEQANCFAQPAEVSHWISAIECRIGPWIKEQGNKALWDVVLFTSQRQGIIKKPLSRLKFAKLLVELCPKALSATDTVSSIKASMEKSEFTKKQMTGFDDLLSTHKLKLLVAEIDGLFASGENYEPPVKPECTLKSRLEQYLRGIVDEQTEKIPCSVIKEHPVYGDIKVTLSIETFQTSKFKENNTPSYIVAYECIDGIVDSEKVYSLIGRSKKVQGIKLWIVSSNGFRNEVVRLARENSIGLMRIDLNTGVNDDSFILPRSVEDHVRCQQSIETMKGERRMEYPLLSWKENLVTSSMVEVLAAEGVRIKNGLLLKAPFLSNDKIEKLANELTDTLTEEDLLPVNIDSILQSHELSWQFGELPTEQLGIIALSKKIVTINSSLQSDTPRIRFTLAHELGHHLLHKDLLESFQMVSFGETDSTLDTTPVAGVELSWLEHHANHFASCLLMPRKTVIRQYEKFFEAYITACYGDKLAPLYWDDNNQAAKDNCLRLLKPLSSRFKVSVEAMKWRLKSLNLLTMGKSMLHSEPRLLRYF